MNSIRKIISRSYKNYLSFKHTTNLEFAGELPDPQLFSLIDINGSPKTDALSLTETEITTFKRVLEKMEETLIIDDILLKAQRQGRISFYMTSTGETATILGVAASLNPQDTIFSQYREMSSLYYRGFTIKEITDNCVGNHLDINKGRQMPIHFSCGRLGFFSVSSPIGTQIPQAAGFGYGLRTSKEKLIAATFIGDGAASQGDFYTGLNFAQTLGSQLLFILRNNGYAISTPIEEQTSGKTVLDKGLSFGMKGMLVDGNDAIAVYKAGEYLRQYIIENGKPAFLECVTYRHSDHSTSDYSALYRSQEEAEEWKKNDPVKRLRGFLQKGGYIDDAFEEELEKKKKAVKKEVISSLNSSFKEKLPSVDSLFEDVYDVMPETLRRQKEDLKEHLEEYGEEYNLDRYIK